MPCLSSFFRLQARRTLAPIRYQSLTKRALFVMPVSRNSSKRKIEEDDDFDDGPSSQTTAAQESQSQSSQSSKAKKARTGGPTPEHINKVLPVNISFPARIEGTVRIATWNICGWAASQKKGFKNYVEAEDPDILVLSETKVNDVPVDPSLKQRYPHQYWSISEKKTYSGLAILSKHEALSVDTTLPGHPDPSSVKGRIVTLEFETCYLVGTYVVNAGMQLKTLEQKKIWNTHFDAYLRNLDKKKPVIWTGDLNVAPTELDLTNAKKNWNKSAGYTEVETTAFKNILELPDNPDANKFVDVWRSMHPEDQQYTYFSYRFNCRVKGIGWRLDMFVLSERLSDRAKMCEIRGEIYGASDHCPVVLEIEEPL